MPLPETSNNPAGRQDVKEIVALVAGADSGIGLAASNGLAQVGCQVVLAGRKTETVEPSAAQDGRKCNDAVGQIDIGVAATDMTRKMEIGTPEANRSTSPDPVLRSIGPVNV